MMASMWVDVFDPSNPHDLTAYDYLELEAKPYDPATRLVGDSGIQIDSQAPNSSGQLTITPDNRVQITLKVDEAGPWVYDLAGITSGVKDFIFGGTLTVRPTYTRIDV